MDVFKVSERKDTELEQFQKGNGPRKVMTNQIQMISHSCHNRCRDFAERGFLLRILCEGHRGATGIELVKKGDENFPKTLVLLNLPNIVKITCQYHAVLK